MVGGSLQDFEDLGEEILRNMNTAVLVVDADACVARCNDAAAAILGREPTDYRTFIRKFAAT